jgi:membrane protease YdiL (CAAX protease family)
MLYHHTDDRGGGMEEQEFPTKRVTAPKWLIRLSQNTVVRIVLAILFTSIPVFGLQRIFHLIPDQPWMDTMYYRIPHLLLHLGVMHGMYILYVRIIERRREREVNPHFLWSDGIKGVGIGVLIVASVHIVLLISGNYSIAGYLDFRNLGFFLFIGLVAGYTEELYFRGILFRLVEQSLGSWIALAVSSLLFGFMHSVNPNATILSSLFITLEAGLVTAGAFMLTRRLWMSMGIHFAWNFTLGGVWGTPVSGIDNPGMFRGVLRGPDLVTGGGFGIEASVVTAILATASGILLIVMAIRKGRFIPAPWARPRPMGSFGDENDLEVPELESGDAKKSVHDSTEN